MKTIGKFIYLHVNLIFRMNKFGICLIIFLMVIAISIQSIYAEQDIPVEGLFAKQGVVKLVTTDGTNYQIYLQAVIRNADGQLINVTESTAHGSFIPHMISDHVFDTLMTEKEIVTIDNVKYEKAQWKFSPSLEQRFISIYPIFSEFTINFVSEPGDNTTKMYGEKKDYSIWKIHYCAEWENFGYSCIPVYQVLVPNMTLEPTDIVEQQWTILRQLD